MADHSGAFAPALVTSPLSTGHPNLAPAGVPAPTAISPERAKAAQSLAAEVAAQVSRAVFNAAICGHDSWRYGRWLCFLEPKSVIPVEPEQFITSANKLPEKIAEGFLTNAQLSALSQAVDQQLTQRNPGASSQATVARQQPA